MSANKNTLDKISHSNSLAYYDHQQEQLLENEKSDSIVRVQMSCEGVTTNRLNMNTNQAREVFDILRKPHQDAYHDD